MSVQIIDYDATTPVRGAFESDISIPSGPFSLQLAELRINIEEEGPNRVELIATVGTQSPELQQVLFTIFRDGAEIFRAQQGIQDIDTTTFQTIDFNVPPGAHVYTLTAEILDFTSESRVIGPVTFSALAIRVEPPEA